MFPTRSTTWFAAQASRLSSPPTPHPRLLVVRQPGFSTSDANAANPFDFYRAHISDVVAGINGVNASDVFRTVQRPQRLHKDDCILTAPALRTKGKKPD